MPNNAVFGIAYGGTVLYVSQNLLGILLYVTLELKRTAWTQTLPQLLGSLEFQDHLAL